MLKVIIINTKNNLELIRNYEEHYFEDQEGDLADMARMVSDPKGDWEGVEAKEERSSH
jgi:hypothetical protein